MLDIQPLPTPKVTPIGRRFPRVQTPVKTTVATRPTPDDLPTEDNVPMETEPHRIQMELLISTLKPWLAQHGGGYVSGNMFLYFSKTRSRRRDVRGPDVFVVLGASSKARDRWAVWDEGKGPEVIIELLSKKTARQDKGKKKRIYQDQLKVAEYFWFDPLKPDDWAGFELVRGKYRDIGTAGQTHLLSKQLGLTLVRWQGVHEGLDRVWLRWATLDGELLPTDKEQANKAEQRATAENLARQEAEHRATTERLARQEAEQRAVLEMAARRAAEAEIARLTALLAQKPA